MQRSEGGAFRAGRISTERMSFVPLSRHVPEHGGQREERTSVREEAGLSHTGLC